MENSEENMCVEIGTEKVEIPAKYHPFHARIYKEDDFKLSC